jgi:hypothetical protein
MSDHDAFDRAVKALRETGETSAADVARTRLRIMETLHRGERRGRRTMWVLLPIAAVLAGSTALAKNSEVVHRVWTGVAETIGIGGPAEKAAPLATAKGSVGRPAAATAAEPGALGEAPSTPPLQVAPPSPIVASGAVEGEPAQGNEPSTAGDTARQATASEDSRRQPAAPRGRPRPAAVRATPTPVNPLPEAVEPAASAASLPNDGEAAALALYKKAYRLHFVDQKYAAALAAWDEYLRASPAGRLVVEARYNRAIALVRLGRRAEAESALAPFARGEVNDGYRAREARELLDVLNAPVR